MDLQTFNQLLSAAVNSGASDIHVKASAPPAIRVHGQLRELRMPALAPEDMQRIATYLVREHQMSGQLQSVREMNVSYRTEAGRFRVVLFRQRGSFAAVMHCISPELPTIRGLGLPAVFESIAESPQGLVLCTGVPGSGRSTTIAALLQHVNTKLRRHIVTIEEPVEFVFQDQQSRFTQREVGSDTTSYASALAAALRLDPDVLMVGELADLPSLEIALRAAESGVLVISSLSSPSVQSAIQTLLHLHPEASRTSLRWRLAHALKAVCAQHLARRKGDQGMVAVVEVYRQSPKLAEWLAAGREAGLAELLESEHASSGTQSYAQHLRELQGAGVLAPEEAEAVRLELESA